MAQLRTRKYFNKQILTAIGNKDPEEIGRLVLDMMENTNRLYDELSLDESQAGEDDYFDYVYTRPESDVGNVPNMDAYQRLMDEYTRRFSGIDNEDNTPENPVAQPPVDTITIGINPNTGTEETRLGENMDLVKEEDIFGEEYR